MPPALQQIQPAFVQGIVSHETYVGLPGHWLSSTQAGIDRQQVAGPSACEQLAVFAQAAPIGCVPVVPAPPVVPALPVVPPRPAPPTPVVPAPPVVPALPVIPALPPPDDPAAASLPAVESEPQAPAASAKTTTISPDSFMTPLDPHHDRTPSAEARRGKISPTDADTLAAAISSARVGPMLTTATGSAVSCARRTNLKPE